MAVKGVRVYLGCKAMKAALKAPDRWTYSHLGISPPKTDEFEIHSTSFTQPLAAKGRSTGNTTTTPRAQLGCGRTADPIGPGRNADRSGGVISD